MNNARMHVKYLCTRIYNNRNPYAIAGFNKCHKSGSRQMSSSGRWFDIKGAD